MTASPTATAPPWWRPPDRSWLAVGVTALAAIAFVAVSPGPIDLWAARARDFAAEHGVGLQYWFSWFSGTVPGDYSVLLPWIYRSISPMVLGSLATVGAVALTRVLAAGSTRPVLATWLAAAALTANLWAGRIPFAVGTVLMIVAWIGIRRRSSTLAVVGGLLAALVTPASGVFTALGLLGVFLHDRERRWSAALCAGTIIALLGAIGLYFGMPGTQGYGPARAALTIVAIALLLAARPPNYVRAVLIAALVICPVLVFVPNGMGANFVRLVWIVLPVAVVATGRAPQWRSAVASLLVVCIGVFYGVRDVVVSTTPTSSPGVYQALVEELNQRPTLGNYRLQIPYDGIHTSAFVLLDVIPLAFGWETQSRHQFNHTLSRPDLSADTYRAWLDSNAVRWVAIPRHPHSPGPEYRLVHDRTPSYLTMRFADAQWLLYEVEDAVPIVDAPGRVKGVAQATMTITAPDAGNYQLRVHYSRFLHVSGPGAVVEPSGDGWSRLVVDEPGTYVISG